MTTRVMVLLSRQASSRFQVPLMFDSKVERGERLATPTIACAARWKQVSTSYSLIARSTSAKSAIEPWTRFMRSAIPCSRSRRSPAESRIMPTTLAPAPTSASHSQLATKPPAPVTSTGRARQKSRFLEEPILSTATSYLGLYVLVNKLPHWRRHKAAWKATVLIVDFERRGRNTAR